MVIFVFFFKQKTAYEITVRDWSSDVCSSDLDLRPGVYVRRSRVGSLRRALLGFDERSEERRVGKECGLLCRSRWSPSHEKKKWRRRTRGRATTLGSRPPRPFRSP